MGQGQAKRQGEFERLSSLFSKKELDSQRSAFTAAKGKDDFLERDDFKAEYDLPDELGNRLFSLIAKDGTKICFEDLVIAKALYEKEAPPEVEEFLFDLLDVEGTGSVTRTSLETVCEEMLQNVLTPKYLLEAEAVDALLAAATFTGKDGTMTMADFRSWTHQAPSAKRYLSSLLVIPTREAPGRSFATLVCTPEVAVSQTVLKKEHSWHICGMLQEKDCKEWVLLFNSTVHGLSFSTLLGRISVWKGATVLVVRDAGGAIFGGFASQPWERHSDFYGDVKTFLFTLQPKLSIWRPTAKNTNIQWCGSGFTCGAIPNGVGFGGQANYFALFLNDGFDKCASRPCATFDNPCLASGPSFNPEVVECWAVVDASKVATDLSGKRLERLGTILDRYKEDRNFLHMAGIGGATDNLGS